MSKKLNKTELVDLEKFISGLCVSVVSKTYLLHIMFGNENLMFYLKFTELR